MHLNPIKKTILEAMIKERQPRKPKYFAAKVGLNFSSCMMHILGLKKAGYVSSPEKGYYQITALGTRILKLRVSKEEATSLLNPVSSEKEFYFHTGINNYSGTHANSLLDFCKKLENVELKSIEFHLFRKDFEQWLKSIGDLELAKKMGIIRKTGTLGEELRRIIHKTAKDRCNELLNLSRTSKTITPMGK